MVNINRLKGKIVEKGSTVDQVAKAMGLHRSTLYRKFKANSDGFLIKDVEEITEILGLTEEETKQIFFDQKVADVR